jgi:2'-5' RNA ligase
VTRGVVLWPDEATVVAVRQMWEMLAAHDLPTLATLSHRRHRPHVSLTVAEDLPIQPALAALGAVPTRAIGLRIDAVGVFPPAGTLFLACVVHEDLLTEHRRVHDSVAPLALRPWPYYRPGSWTPHITISQSLSTDQLAIALPAVLARLPLEGSLERGGVEDGTTGQRWPTCASA